MANKRILLVDDDDITNMINTKLLMRGSDFNVSAYTNAQEALRNLRDLCDSNPENLPGAIFLDINMPIMDGWEFLEVFQTLPDAVLDRCKVTILTSSIDSDDIEKSKKFHTVTGFVSKPLTTEMIRSLLAP